MEKYKDLSLDFNTRVADLVSRMTLVEKVSQLKHGSKGISRLGILPYNWWNESLHGVARNGIATVFPQSICLAATFDKKLMSEIAEVISDEGREKYRQAQEKHEYDIYKGLTFWSPNVNIFRDPRWGRGQETYGEDPYLSARMGVAFVKGLQGDDPKYLKAAACAKHYAVHSGPEAERHYFDAEVSEKDLRETYLPAFKALVTEGNVAGVMGAYNRVNGHSCCAHPYLMEAILRGEWKFSGYYVSDCGGVSDIIYYHKLFPNPLKGTAYALKTGCDLECGTLYPLLTVSEIFKYLSMEDIDKAVSRLLLTRMKLGMFDGDSCPYNNKVYPIATKKNEELAIEAAEKGIVMLKNDGVLPLKISKDSKIAIIGPNATNENAYLGNYFGTPSSFVYVDEGIRNLGYQNVVVEKGCHLFNETDKDNNMLLESAIKTAENSEIVILCTGFDPSIEGEEAGEIYANSGNIGKQGDRTGIELPKVQQTLIENIVSLNKPVILLNFSGGAVTFLPFLDKVNAVYQCWYPGAKAGTAIARLLFGLKSPSGKLPVTFYKSDEDLPPFYDYSMKNRTYRYFKDEVLFPFGFGLSYTHFTYSNLICSQEKLSKGRKIYVKVSVSNDGNINSQDAAQLYITKLNAENQPLFSLKSINKFFLKKGEKKELEFILTENDFKYFNDNGEEQLLPDDEFLISVGNEKPNVNCLTAKVVYSA